ncbi:MAG TPA: hypothetical protein VKE40_12390 [Gemmataceae bacterium]|nr:hypothetical protein [Gemmataceae bacterium]
MSTNIKTLLATAAEIRAVGHPWEAVAKKVNRRAKTCRGWPGKYPTEWQALYRQVEERRFEETSKEAHSYLINLLRHEDPKVKLKAEEIWHKYGRVAYGRGGSMVLPPAEPGPAGKNDALLRELAALMDVVRREIDRRRALDGKPPATDDEFMEAWERQGANQEEWRRREPEDGGPSRPTPEQQDPNPPPRDGAAARPDEAAPDDHPTPTPPASPAPTNGAGNPVIVFGVLLLAAAVLWQRPAYIAAPAGPECVRALLPDARGGWCSLPRTGVSRSSRLPTSHRS